MNRRRKMMKPICLIMALLITAIDPVTVSAGMLHQQEEIISMEAYGTDEGSNDEFDPVELISNETLPDEDVSGGITSGDSLSDEDMSVETISGEDISDEGVSRNMIKDDPKQDNTVSGDSLPYGLAGMPEGYALTDEQLEMQDELREHDIDSTLEGLSAGEDYESNEVFFLTEDEEYANLAAAAYNGTLKSFDDGVAVIDLSEAGISVADAVRAGMDPENNLPPVEPNYRLHLITDAPSAFSMPSYDVSAASTDVAVMQSYESLYESGKLKDPFLNPANKSYQWFHNMINTYEAWGVTTGSSNITIAVIDTGVSDHEDFGSRLTRYHVPATPADNSGHGTNVAGIAAAGLNSKGGAGVAPGVKVLGISVFTYDSKEKACYADQTDVIKAINYVANGTGSAARRADIINLSLGGRIFNSSYGTVIGNAYKKGVTVIASAGNEASNAYAWPAGYDHVIAVAAVDQRGAKTDFSNPSPYVDIAAPGYNMFSTWNRTEAHEEDVMYPKSDTSSHSEYGQMNGTSQAAPVIAGACALYMSAVGHVDPDTMEKVLLSSTNKAATNGTGAGIIDLAKMFSKDRTAPVITYTDNKGTVTYDAKITIKAGDGITKSSGITGLGGKIIYTVNGKNPTILNGEVVNGEIYTSALTAGGLVRKYGIKAGQTVTIKAATVSGMGVLSNVKSVSFKVSDAATGVSIDAYPESIAAGGSYKFSATMTPEGSSQKALWEIVQKDAKLTGAKINASTGVLTTKAGQTGKLKIKCTAQSGGKPSQTTGFINITDKAKLKKLTLNKPNLTIDFGTSGKTGTISVQKVEDALNTAGLKPDSYMYKWVSSDENVVSITSSEVSNKSVTVRAEGKGRAKITCMAMDGSNVTAVCNITVTQLAVLIRVEGQKYIAPGTTAGYKAMVQPAEANDKKVTWSLSGAPAGVKVDTKTGKLTADRTAASGKSFKIIATSTDNGKVKGEFTVTTASRAASVKVTPTISYSKDAMIPEYDKAGSLKSARMYTVNAQGGNDESSLTLNAKVSASTGTAGGQVLFTSSNPDVVEVITASGTSTSVKAHKAGTARITCMADDGSGKKAVVTIKVIVPASDLKVIPVNDQAVIAGGCSAACKNIIGDLYGKPSINKVTWDFAPVPVDSKFSPSTGEGFGPPNKTVKEAVSSFKLMKMSNGKVSVTQAYINSTYYSFCPAVMVTAKTTDGTNLTSSAYFYAVPKLGRMYVPGNIPGIIFNSKTDPLNTMYTVPLKNCGPGKITTTVSNTKVLTAYVSNGMLVINPLKKGNATIRYKRNDGSGASGSFKVVIR